MTKIDVRHLTQLNEKIGACRNYTVQQKNRSCRGGSKNIEMFQKFTLINTLGLLDFKNGLLLRL